MTRVNTAISNIVLQAGCLGYVLCCRMHLELLCIRGAQPAMVRSSINIYIYASCGRPCQTY
jgi:hypothetical protein